jgi:glycosyltransferase involved in cell wall biosynthesis
MRIALIVTSLGVGGAETQVMNLADRLDASGHQVLVVSMMDEIALAPRRESVTVRSLGVEKTVASLARGYARAWRMMRDFAPDVVHSHMVHANLFSRLLRLLAPVPRLICTAHSINEGGALRMWLYRMTDALAHLTTNVSQAAVDYYLACSAISPGKALAVYNGIDCDQFRFDPALREAVRSQFDVPAGTQVLLAAGRICEAKDYPNLLRAFALVAAQRPECVLWIAGAGSAQCMAELHAQVAALGMRDRVRLLGLRRDVHALMCAADIFVLSSCVEGFPLVVGEAMACERAVVCTDAGGTAEWLGPAGGVVPVRDSGALAGALLGSLDVDPHSRRLQGAAARERIVTHYSLAAVTRKWERIYRGMEAADQADAASAAVEMNQQAIEKG